MRTEMGATAGLCDLGTVGFACALPGEMQNPRESTQDALS